MLGQLMLLLNNFKKKTSISTRGYQVAFRGMDVLSTHRRGFLSCSVGSGFKIWMISCETIGLWLTLKS